MGADLGLDFRDFIYFWVLPRPQSRHTLLLLASTALATASPHQPPFQDNGAQAVLQAPIFHSDPDSHNAAPHPSSHSIGGHLGAVASEALPCSRIGTSLLTLGGNAVDAWIGTQLCVGVIGMHHSGLGGGGFAVIRDSDENGGGHYVIDYREAAPAAASENMYQGNVNGSIWGGLAAGIPGELRGLEAAHAKFGKLAWRDVVLPAADIAGNGFQVTADLVRYMNYGIAYAGWNFLVEDPSWAQDFAPKGRLVRFGETMTRTRYAETLRRVAEGGADVFYQGEIAEEMIDMIQTANGTMTMEDLEGYEALWRQPLEMRYKGDYHLFTSGVPSSGAVLMNTLNIIQGYDDADDVDANTTLHRFNEAMRFAYGAHQVLGDPAYLDDDVTAFEASLLDSAHAKAIRGRILDNTTQPVTHYLPDKGLEHHYAAESHGTSHIVTADASGMAVSSTTTVNLLFGNLQCAQKSGIIMNDEMNDFSLPGRRNEFGYSPAPANYIRPGKRPLSSITPVIIEDRKTGRLIATVGAAGGSRIISSTTQVIWHLLGNGYTGDKAKPRERQDEEEKERQRQRMSNTHMSMLKAIKEPRIHDQLMPDVTMFEWAFDNATVHEMEVGKGHNVMWVREGLSAVQGIRVFSKIEDDEVDGVGDMGHGEKKRKSKIAAFEAVGETRQLNSGGLTV